MAFFFLHTDLRIILKMTLNSTDQALTPVGGGVTFGCRVITAGMLRAQLFKKIPAPKCHTGLASCYQGVTLWLGENIAVYTLGGVCSYET